MKKGQKAPEFSLKDQNGKTHSLKSLKGDYKVVYFYPKDDTPGCTIQAKEYTKSLATFKKMKADVVGISGGDEMTKKKFCKKHGLKVLLLSDPQYAVAKKWGAFGKKMFMGKKYDGILRNTYLLDKAGKVLATFEKVDPETDTTELLSAIKQMTTKTKTVSLGKPMKRTTTKRTATKKATTKTARVTTKTTRTVAKATPTAKARKTGTVKTTVAKTTTKPTLKITTKAKAPAKAPAKVLTKRTLKRTTKRTAGRR